MLPALLGSFCTCSVLHGAGSCICAVEMHRQNQTKELLTYSKARHTLFQSLAQKEPMCGLSILDTCCCVWAVSFHNHVCNLVWNNCNLFSVGHHVNSGMKACCSSKEWDIWILAHPEYAPPKLEYAPPKLPFYDWICWSFFIFPIWLVD